MLLTTTFWLLTIRSVGGGDVKSIPHPDEDWGVFIAAVKTKSQEEVLVWDPLAKQPKEWINMKKLQDIYGTSSSSSTCVMS